MGLTNQEAIEILKANYPTSNYSELREAVDMVLTLLQKQEPVKPELRMSRHGFRQWVVCGNCYGKIDGGDDYCRHCGRKVVWNE